MTFQTTDDRVLNSIRSSVILENSLVQLIKSMCDLIEGEINMKNDATIGNTIYNSLIQVNELQKLMERKFFILLDRFSALELYYASRFSEHFEDLNDNTFLNYIALLQQLSNEFSLEEWRRSGIINEVNQVLFMYKKRRNLLKSFRPKNDVNTVWYAPSISYK